MYKRKSYWCCLPLRTASIGKGFDDVTALLTNQIEQKFGQLQLF